MTKYNPNNTILSTNNGENTMSRANVTNNGEKTMSKTNVTKDVTVVNKITNTQLLKLYSALLDTANLLDYAVARACSKHTHDKARAFERVLVLMWEIDKISHRSGLTRVSRGGLAQDNTVDDLIATANIIKRDVMTRLGY